MCSVMNAKSHVRHVQAFRTLQCVQEVMDDHSGVCVCAMPGTITIAIHNRTCIV